MRIADVLPIERVTTRLVTLLQCPQQSCVMLFPQLQRAHHRMLCALRRMFIPSHKYHLASVHTRLLSELDG